MEIRRIRVADIIVTERPRALQPTAVAELTESIKQIGLQSPITVRMVNGAPHLVTGLHRLEATKRGEFDQIECFIFDNELDARIWSLDENLKRADLTPPERLEQIAARAVLIEERMKAEKQAAPKHTSRDDAKAAGATFYYPAEACIHGHEAKRYVSTGECTECNQIKKARYSGRQRGEAPVEVAHRAPVLPREEEGGRGHKAGNRAAARELGVGKDTVRRAKAFAKLTERAKAEAVKLGLANNPHVMKYVGAHDTADLQVKAVRSQAQKQAEKKERKRLEQATIAEQAAARTPPRELPLIDQRREATVGYFEWLVMEFGDKAFAIVNRLREVDVALLIQTADRARDEGKLSKPSVH